MSFKDIVLSFRNCKHIDTYLLQYVMYELFLKDDILFQKFYKEIFQEFEKTFANDRGLKNNNISDLYFETSQYFKNYVENPKGNFYKYLINFNQKNELQLTENEQKIFDSLKLVVGDVDAKNMVILDRSKLNYNDSVSLLLKEFPYLTDDEILLIKEDQKNISIILKHEINEKENLSKADLDHLIDIFNEFINNTKMQDCMNFSNSASDLKQELDFNNFELEYTYVLSNITLNNPTIMNLMVGMFAGLTKSFGGELSEDEISDMRLKMQLPLDDINKKIDEKYGS